MQNKSRRISGENKISIMVEFVSLGACNGRWLLT
jgi:hypothetical protein